MKAQVMRLGPLAAVAAAVVIVLVGFWYRPANAALGNQGAPVRCYYSGNLSAGNTVFLTCVTPPGQPGFVSSQRVPGGYYFLVTDIMVTPNGGTAGDALVQFYLFDAYGASSRSSSIRFRTYDGHTYAEHFTAPMYVLTPDHRLEVQAFGSNQQSFEIRIYGLLTNNVTYLPSVLQN